MNSVVCPQLFPHVVCPQLFPQLFPTQLFPNSREIILADGTRKAVPMIGPLRIHFADRYCDLSALVMGDESLFGAVPMEMMDLVLHPATQTLTVNPASPYVPVALAK